MFADVFKFYKDSKGRFTSKDKSVSGAGTPPESSPPTRASRDTTPSKPTVRTMEEDMQAQMEWLQEKAKEKGHSGLDALAEKDFSTFMALGEEWRKHNVFKGFMSILKCEGKGVAGFLFGAR